MDKSAIRVCERICTKGCVVFEPLLLLATSSLTCNISQIVGVFPDGWINTGLISRECESL